jgi:hypothetical protein
MYAETFVIAVSAVDENLLPKTELGSEFPEFRPASVFPRVGVCPFAVPIPCVRRVKANIKRRIKSAFFPRIFSLNLAAFLSAFICPSF